MAPKYQKEIVELFDTDQEHVALAACEYSGIGVNGKFKGEKTQYYENFPLSVTTVLVRDVRNEDDNCFVIGVDRGIDTKNDYKLTDRYVIRFFSEEIDVPYVIDKLKTEFCK